MGDIVYIVEATQQMVEPLAGEIADLAHSTGPVTYDFQFGTRALFEKMIAASWRTPSTLFSWDTTRFAMAGDEVRGFLVSFHAPEFRERIAALAPTWKQMIASGDVSPDEFSGLTERARYARWLNPETRPGIYYIHAIAAKPEHRGKGVGLTLFKHAIELAKQANCKVLELDVLSDNPAVDFYKSMGLEVLVESRSPKAAEYGVPTELRMGMKLV